MKLIITHDWQHDEGYGASGTHTIPFEYSSLEQAYLDFCELRDKTRAKVVEQKIWIEKMWPVRRDNLDEFIRLSKDRDHRDYLPTFQFAGHEWYEYDDEDNTKFYTLEEWFDKHKSK